MHTRVRMFSVAQEFWLHRMPPFACRLRGADGFEFPLFPVQPPHLLRPRLGGAAVPLPIQDLDYQLTVRESRETFSAPGPAASVIQAMSADEAAHSSSAEKKPFNKHIKFLELTRADRRDIVNDAGSCSPADTPRGRFAEPGDTLSPAPPSSPYSDRTEFRRDSH